MRFWYRRLTAMLLRERMQANHKRVYRSYREEGLCDEDSATVGGSAGMAQSRAQQPLNE
jgi:hypothetical protein